MTRPLRDAPQFYLTSPTTCPYLPGREERKVFTHLVGARARDLNDVLSQGGFRRSQSIAYRPACESCRACVSVRVCVNDFRLSRGFRRIATRNSDLIGEALPPQPRSEHYSLFRSYLDERHPEGGMATMSALDFAMMVEDTHVETSLIEYRRRGPDSGFTGRGQGDLFAMALTDTLNDGLSMVYSVYDPSARAALARHLHGARSYRPRPQARPALCLSRLLGRWFAQNGLQIPLHAAGAADAPGLGTRRLSGF